MTIFEKKNIIMKKTILLITFLSIVFKFNAQENFQWQIKDSVNMSMDEIYSFTKQFIGQTWKSAKDVIQNDDKDNGSILVKGLTSPIVFAHMGATYSYTYSYELIFKMKNNRYMLELNNVKCHSTVGSSFENKLFIEPDKCPSGNKKFEEKCNQLMIDLKAQLQNIVDLYTKSILSHKSDW